MNEHLVTCYELQVPTENLQGMIDQLLKEVRENGERELEIRLLRKRKEIEIWLQT